MVHHIWQRLIPLPTSGGLSTARQEPQNACPELPTVLLQNLPVPLVHTVEIPHILKDDEEIFARPAA